MKDSAGITEQPSELASRWFRIALWVAALPPAIAALSLALYSRKLGQIHSDDEVLAGFILALPVSEALSLVPIFLFARWWKRTVVSFLGHDLRLLKATMFGSVIGMLSPYFYLTSGLALQALTPIKNLELEQAAWRHDLVYGYTLLPGLAAIVMLFTTIFGGLIGWGFAKLVVRTRRPTIGA